MIIWIDGTYGIGKTAVAFKIKDILTDNEVEIMEADVYFPEMIYKNNYSVSGGTLPQTNKDFIIMFKNLIEEKLINKNLIIDMALTNRECKEGIFDCLVNAGINILHIILTANEETVISRIEHDERREDSSYINHLQENTLFFKENFLDATLINTDGKSEEEIANEIVSHINFG